MSQHVTPRISLFPKCYFDPLVSGEMDYLAWIRSARDARRRRARALRRVLPQLSRRRRRSRRSRRWRRPARSSSMLCFSPDFTHPDPAERARQVDAAAGGDRSRRQARHPVLPHAQRPGASRADARATGSSGRSTGLLPLARVRRAPRRRPVPGEPLQGRHLAVPGVRAAGRHLPGDPRSRRLAAARRPVRSVERDRRRLRSDPLSRAGAAARRDDARVGSLARAGGDARGSARARRRDRLLGQAAARRDRQGADRLRRDLPHPGARGDSPDGSRSRTASTGSTSWRGRSRS